METIFDFNPTIEELRYLDLLGMTKEAYITESERVKKIYIECAKKAGIHQDFSNWYAPSLARLFQFRGDKKNMNKYLDLFAPKGSVERADFFRHSTFIRKGDYIIAD